MFAFSIIDFYLDHIVKRIMISYNISEETRIVQFSLYEITNRYYENDL